MENREWLKRYAELMRSFFYKSSLSWFNLPNSWYYDIYTLEPKEPKVTPIKFHAALAKRLRCHDH